MTHPVTAGTKPVGVWRTPEESLSDASHLLTIAHDSSAVARLRPAKINFYLKVANRLGFNSEEVLAGSGVTPENLTDPRHLIEVADYIHIVARMHQLCDSPSLAFTLGEQLTLGDLGILGYTVMTSPTSAEATKLWFQYISVFFGGLVGFACELVGDQLLLSYLPDSRIPDALLQFSIEERICCDMALQRLIGIPEFPVDRLTLTYSQPRHVDCYRDLIPCPIDFDSKRNTMLLSSNALAIPLKGADPETHQHCLKLLTSAHVFANAGSTFPYRVRAILHGNPQLGIDDVARMLHCTPRTLNRRLEKDSLNFSQIQAEIRLEVVETLLSTTDLDFRAIARQAGFADARSLRRFFKTRTGMTLQQFRDDCARNHARMSAGV
ncbi:AraC family transcriptional regulator ligand-binding domain-containing protein [Mycolicibacterium pulveris]|uniref:Transcriptional regulator n=1 Tax=Mycolicibacterium pulveris TaxID=36813 RepID=A0A7I7UPX2_MYCPV|nr:AraC family transcriptional regulator [Mycolicibacterium pulveris]MCV6983518.1 AraC family transcriptional regulator ligand-binding domain-containing protein [Mycolicibacterium pulveris]BBY83397.1 transcriptional regulator [Mycolicibacterium pulveris]